MENKAHALSRDELIRVLTVYTGITTSDGDVVDTQGTTLIDSSLIGKNDFISGKTILLMSGDAKHEDKGALSFDNTTGKITLESGVSAQIKAGTIFRVLNISSVETLIKDLSSGLVSYSGETTAEGGAGGSSLICSDLTDEADFNGNQVVITSGDYKGQARDINGVTTGGTVTPNLNFGGVIVEGTKFIITAIRTTPAEVAELEAKLDTGGLGVGLVTKALTFNNDTGQVNLFTVTGDVIVRIVAVVKTTCGSVGGCNVSVGIAGDVDAIIPVTDITLLAAQEIWHDATPDSEIEALGSMREHIVSDGNDITLNSDAADNSGAITFYCFWTALSTGATVVAA